MISVSVQVNKNIYVNLCFHEKRQKLCGGFKVVTSMEKKKKKVLCFAFITT